MKLLAESKVCCVQKWFQPPPPSLIPSHQPHPTLSPLPHPSHITPTFTHIVVLYHVSTNLKLSTLQLGRNDLYLSKMATIGGQVGIWCKALKSYLAGAGPTEAVPKGGKVDPSKLADLFLFNVLNAALLIKKTSPLTPASAIDFLCVSGPVQFPPTEGGPLNYLIRNGRERIAERLEQLRRNVTLADEVTKLAAMLRQSEASPEELLGESNDVEEASGDEFSRKRSELCVLKASELQAVGPCMGLRHKEDLIRPLPFHLPSLLLLLAVVATVVCAGLGALLWGAALLVLAVGSTWTAAVGLVTATAAVVFTNNHKQSRRKKSLV